MVIGDIFIYIHIFSTASNASWEWGKGMIHEIASEVTSICLPFLLILYKLYIYKRTSKLRFPGFAPGARSVGRS